MVNDYFIKEEVYDILDNNQNKIGVDVVTYKILKLLDTKNLTVSNTYSVTVKHRLQVSGSGWEPGGNYQTAGFNNYPILVNVQSGIAQVSNSATEIILKK